MKKYKYFDIIIDNATTEYIFIMHFLSGMRNLITEVLKSPLAKLEQRILVSCKKVY